MGRKVDATQYVTFIPEAFKQREQYDAAKARGAKPDDPDMNPVIVEMRWLTAAEKRAYENAVTMKVRKDGELSAPNKRATEKRLLSESVRLVKNYEISGVAITTGEQLYDQGENEISQEVIGALLDGAMLEAGRRDLSSSQSGG